MILKLQKRVSCFAVLDFGNLATRLVSKRSCLISEIWTGMSLVCVRVREQPKMSASFVTKNSPTVSMDSGENSKSFASAIGAVSIEFWSERIVTFFVVKLMRKFLQKCKKKTKQKNIYNIQKKINCSFSPV